MSKIIPLGDKVLLEVILEDEQTEGGIILPTVVRESTNKGKVLGVGEGTLLENGDFNPIALKEGDVVIFNKNAGTTIKEGTIDYLIIGIRDIIGQIVE